MLVTYHHLAASTGKDAAKCLQELQHEHLLIVKLKGRIYTLMNLLLVRCSFWRLL